MLIPYLLVVAVSELYRPHTDCAAGAPNREQNIWSIKFVIQEHHLVSVYSWTGMGKMERIECTCLALKIMIENKSERERKEKEKREKDRIKEDDMLRCRKDQQR